jgi:riboflavin synthase
MFTGIVSSIGSITGSVKTGQDLLLKISAPNAELGRVVIGDSIAVAGVCLTVTAISGNEFTADVSVETLDVTTLGMLQAGDPVNLELALRAGDALGGHLVSGHVDGRAEVLGRIADGRSERFEFQVAEQLSRYIAAKGSVCINGVSLTVNSTGQQKFAVNLVPHTLENTTLGQLQCGDWVNIEVDMLARYVERLL